MAAKDLKMLDDGEDSKSGSVALVLPEGCTLEGDNIIVIPKSKLLQIVVNLLTQADLS